MKTICDNLTVYFDASCQLCSAEIMNLKRLDKHQQLHLVDCSAADFDARPFAQENITREDMMTNLHVKDGRGQWYKGVDAFAVLYRIAGLPLIAKFWNSPLTKPLTTRLYPWVVRHRYLLSKIGVTRLFEYWGKAIANRAHRRSQGCQNNQCSISPEQGE